MERAPWLPGGRTARQNAEPEQRPWGRSKLAGLRQNQGPRRREEGEWVVVGEAGSGRMVQGLVDWGGFGL